MQCNAAHMYIHVTGYALHVLVQRASTDKRSDSLVLAMHGAGASLCCQYNTLVAKVPPIILPTSK